MVVYWNNRSRSLNSGFVNYKLSYLVSVLQKYSDTKKTKGLLTWGYFSDYTIAQSCKTKVLAKIL